MLQITSGKFKNRNLLFTQKFLSDNRVRPTSNYTKQLLMNIVINSPILNTHINLEDATVVDVCCGTGSIGFEFLSNGAKKCYFIDSNDRIRKNIDKTAKYIGIESACEILPSMTSIKKIDDKIDLVFLDPPYQEQERIIVNFFSIASKSSCITQDTVIIIESFKDQTNLFNFLECDIIFTRKSSSDTVLTGVKFRPE